MEKNVQEPVGIGPLGPSGVCPIRLLLHDARIGVGGVDRLDVHPDADPLELGLQQLRLPDPLRRVLDHELGPEPVREACLGELLPGRLQVVAETLETRIRPPEPGTHRTSGRLPESAQQHVLQLGSVDGEGDRLPQRLVVEGRLIHPPLERRPSGRRLHLGHPQSRLAAETRDVLRVDVGGDIDFAGPHHG